MAMAGPGPPLPPAGSTNASQSQQPRAKQRERRGEISEVAEGLIKLPARAFLPRPLPHALLRLQDPIPGTVIALSINLQAFRL